MATFFLPGVGDDERAIEKAYADMRRQLELDMGRRPSRRRIWQLWTRRGGVDCITEVGMPDPLCGAMVMAIFDMGPHQPFVVWRQPDAGALDSAQEILRCSAYSVLEFDL